ncbi:MAG TPA: ABC transporter permease [Gaiellaceae bacterium]|nr:ABC transporter permease [Gaiellaceae bacterium]
MSESSYITPRLTPRERLAYDARILQVLSRSEFKLKYAGSVLGYVWSLAKPLAYFTVLWVVFGQLFRSTIPHYPLYLLIGIVLNTFLIDAVTATLPSLVSSAATLRRISFPPFVIPLSTSIAAAMTFLLNCVVVGVFLGIGGVEPHLDWLLIVPLLLELYVFTLSIALIVSALYVRFRDVGQIWEVAISLLFFAAPIVYPITQLPPWAERIVSLNPLVQVMQDVRTIILGPGSAPIDSRFAPIVIAAALFAVAVWLFRRESPRFAERA